MNPILMVKADLRSLRWLSWAVPLLIAIAVGTGVGLGAQERMVRASSAHAADDFDLLVGAPGSPTQLVLTSIYLQPEALPLIDGALLNKLAADRRVAGVAPIAFADIIKGYPVVGTTTGFAGRWGRLAPTEGRLFAQAGEAVVGADVGIPLGNNVTPSHGPVGERAPGIETEEEVGHRHEGVSYIVVGRLPRLGTPWDRAILVPVESVWETHGLGNGHETDGAALGPPFEGGKLPGVPALVIKPRSVADAYALRGEYRQGGTTALFPAEVLVSLYRTLGNLRDILVAASAFNDCLIFAATLLLLAALTGLRRRRYAVLRALGAPRSYVLIVVWLQAAALLGIGCLFGLPLGWSGAWLVSRLIESDTGLHLAFIPALSDVAFAVALFGLGSLLAIVPALLSYRAPVADALRS